MQMGKNGKGYEMENEMIQINESILTLQDMKI